MIANSFPIGFVGDVQNRDLNGSFLRSLGKAIDEYYPFSSDTSMNWNNQHENRYGIGNQYLALYHNTDSLSHTFTVSCGYRCKFCVTCLFADDGVLIDGVPFGSSIFGGYGSTDDCVITVPANSRCIICYSCIYCDDSNLRPIKYIDFI